MPVAAPFRPTLPAHMPTGLCYQFFSLAYLPMYLFFVVPEPFTLHTRTRAAARKMFDEERRHAREVDERVRVRPLILFGSSHMIFYLLSHSC